MNQTVDDVRRTADDWGRNFAPADLVQNEKNAKLLADYCLVQFGVVTAGGLTHAYNALRAKLDLVPSAPAPKVKTTDELAAEENTRMYRDYVESVKPQESFEAKVAGDKQKRQADERAKIQADSEQALGQAILNYQCYRVNGAGVDVTATEMVQKDLRTIKIRFPNGQTDFASTLGAVRVVILELEDHPVIGSVNRAIERINARNRK